MCQYAWAKFVPFFTFMRGRVPPGGVPEMIKFGQVQAYDKTTGEATIVYMRPDACAKCGASGRM